MITNIEWTIFVSFRDRNDRAFCTNYKVQAPTRDHARAKALVMFTRDHPESEGWEFGSMRAYKAKRTA